MNQLTPLEQDMYDVILNTKDMMTKKSISHGAWLQALTDLMRIIRLVETVKEDKTRQRPSRLFDGNEMKGS